MANDRVFYSVLTNEMPYTPVKEKRHFTKDKLYSDINWKSFNCILDAFKERIEKWYIEPTEVLAKNGHFSFVILALDGLLINTFSQYREGKLFLDKNTSIDFIRKYLKDENSDKINLLIDIIEDNLTNSAAILYNILCCEGLYQANIPLYGSINPGSEFIMEENLGYVKYSHDNSDCPNLCLNPLKIFEVLKNYFYKYLEELKKSNKNDIIRINFYNKFKYSFGIDIQKTIED